MTADGSDVDRTDDHPAPGTDESADWRRERPDPPESGLDDRYRAIVTDGGSPVVVYDVSNADAWIRSTLAIDLGR